MSRWYLWPLAWLYQLVRWCRHRAYDLGFKECHCADVPVISVGNITSGGTGKTPMILYLAQTLKRRSQRVAIVTRGYKGQLKGNARVDCQEDRAERVYGDEAYFLAQKMHDVPVYVGADRLASIALISPQSVDFILADDAFQHRRLGRDLDVVLLDATAPDWHYLSLPVGYARENFQSLKRADVVFLTKVNVAEERQLACLRRRVRAVVPDKPLIEFHMRLSGLTHLSSGRRFSIDHLRGTPVVLVSALGQPLSFSRLADQELRVRILDHLIFPDHHGYDENSIASILRKCGNLSVSNIVTTEKDAVKLGTLVERIENVWVAEMQLDPSFSEGQENWLDATLEDLSRRAERK